MKEMLVFPNFGRGTYTVWKRNFTYLRQTMWLSFFWVSFEPLVFLFAIGFGIGALVPGVEGQSYLRFFAPGLMTASGMVVAYYESTYGTFSRFFREKNIQTILLAPVTTSEIILGEISWAASKGLLSSLSVALVAAVLGVLPLTYFPVVILVLGANSWLFAACGLLTSSYAKNFDRFVYFQSGLIVPMYVLCGTFFPFFYMPDFLQAVAFLFPLTHSVLAVRAILEGEITSVLILNIGVIFFSALFITNWAAVRMEKRLDQGQ